MRYAFHLSLTPTAAAALGRREQEIVNDLVAQAEKLGLGADESAIFDVHDLGLKAVVNFAKRTVHVLTLAEYAASGMPTDSAGRGVVWAAASGAAPPTRRTDPPRAADASTPSVRAFQVLCSESAAATLSEAERADIVQRVIPMARERDRGVHEGLAFSFEEHGREWHVIVDLGACWVKILDTDEFQAAVRNAVQKN